VFFLVHLVVIKLRYLW